MARDRERDAAMDRLLRDALTRARGGPYRERENRHDHGTTPGGPGPADACPDAGELAAYVEGTLTAREREALEPHLAACERCQEALALMAEVPEASATATEPAAQVPGRWLLAGWRRWLVPVSALASAAILYVALKPEATLRPSPQESVAVTAPAPSSPAPGPVPGTTGRAAADLAPPAETDLARPAEPETPRRKSEPKDAAPRQARGREQSADTLEAVETTPPPVVAQVQPKPDRLAAPVPQLAAAPVASPPAPPAPSGEVTAERQAALPRPGAVGGVPPMKPTRLETEAFAAKSVKPIAEPPPGASVIAETNEAAPGSRADAARPTVVSSGGPSPFLWRFEAGGRILGSDDQGLTWHLQQAAPGGLAAGSAASRQVCWAVGPGGLVLRTIDGRTWRVVPFPERLDLVAVHAGSALEAAVHARDGRAFTTNDGGETWREGAKEKR